LARFIKFPGGPPYIPSPPGFFTFDGVSGSFLSTPNVNLLDADTAHVEQGIGDWVDFDSAENLMRVAVASPAFGSGSLQFSSLNPSPSQVSSQQGLDAEQAPLGDVSVSAWVMSPLGRNVQIGIIAYDGTGANIGEFVGPSTPTTPGVWQQISFGRDVNWAGGRVAIKVVHFATNIGELSNVAAACIRVGTDPAFVPSLSIVGDLEMEALASSASAANQTLIATWTGSGSNGYQFAANLSGNLLARHGDGSVDRFASGSNALTPGVLQAVKGSFDAAGNWSFDIDGTPETVGPTLPGVASPSGGLAVGSNAGGTINLFTGDIASAVVRDGVGGPVVASFLSSDYAGAAGAIPDGTTFTDSVTGRVWTVNGNVVNVLAGTPSFGNSVATPNNGLPANPFIVKNPPDMPDILDDDYWVVGAGWVGEGFKATMHDGTDATGPVVAEFDAGDVGI